MSMAVDEVTRIKEMIRNFVYAVHGWGVSDLDFTSINKRENKIMVKGTFKLKNEEFDFSVELDSDGHLLSYEREPHGRVGWRLKKET